MAFRMAKGSLFSVLLRSPWWYSSLIALLLITITVLAFGGKFLIFGLTAALPFIGISGYTATQQMKRPARSRVLEVTQQAREMPAREVAAKIADTYKKERYDAAPHKGNTADIELTRGSKKLLLSSKRFKAATTGIDPLKQLVAAGEKIEATGYLYVALGNLSPNALEYAKKENIDIIESEALASLFDGKVVIQE